MKNRGYVIAGWCMHSTETLHALSRGCGGMPSTGELLLWD